MGWRDDAEKRMKQISRGDKFKFGEGKNYFRLLPSRDAVLYFAKMKKKTGKGDWKKACQRYRPYLEFVACREVGPEKKFVRSGKLPGGGGKCWLVDTLIPKLERSSNAGDRAKAEKMQPQEQMIIQVAEQDDDGNWVGPLTCYLPKSLRLGLMQKAMSEKRQYDHPIKGFGMTVTRTGTGRYDTNYSSIEPDDDPTPLPLEIIKAIKPWDELVKPYSEKFAKEAWGDELPEDDSEADDGFEDDDDEPKPKRKTRRKKKKPEPEPEPEDDDDDLGDDEDEEEETPKPKKRRRKKKKTEPEPEPEEDDEDFDGDLDDDDDEDADEDDEDDDDEDDDDEDDDDEDDDDDDDVPF